MRFKLNVTSIYTNFHLLNFQENPGSRKNLDFQYWSLLSKIKKNKFLSRQKAIKRQLGNGKDALKDKKARVLQNENYKKVWKLYYLSKFSDSLKKLQHPNNIFSKNGFKNYLLWEFLSSWEIWDSNSEPPLYIHILVHLISRIILESRKILEFCS